MKRNYQSKLRRFWKPIMLFAWSILLLTISTCKEEIKINESSDSGLKYFTGGNNDKVNSIEKTKDGGFIFCGYTGKDETHTDGFMLKVDANGKKEWYKTYGGANLDVFRHAIQTSDGGYLAVGMSNSIGKGSTDGTYNLYQYVVKTNANGDEAWSKSNGTLQGRLTFAVETPDHDFVITGYMTNVKSDVYLLKMDASGKVLLGRIFTNLTTIPPFLVKPNYYQVYGRSVTIANDGDILIGGVMSKSVIVTEAGKHLTFILKASMTNANPIFFYPYYDYVREGSYYFAFADPHQRQAMAKIINLSDGYLLGTYIEPTARNSKIQLMKTDLSGKMIWEREYSGLGNAFLYNMEANPDGSFLVVGMSSRDLMNNSYPEVFPSLKTMLLKVDKDGKEIWIEYIGSETNANISKAISPNAGGGWNVAGYTCLNETGFDRMFWMQVDEDGKLAK